jgi:hypothetical protein
MIARVPKSDCRIPDHPASISRKSVHDAKRKARGGLDNDPEPPAR